MNANQRIERALSGLVNGKIWPMCCPLEEKPDTFAVYHMEVTWFSRPAAGGKKKPVNYLNAEEQIVAALEHAGFTVKNSVSGYEQDTGYTTCTVTFCARKE